MPDWRPSMIRDVALLRGVLAPIAGPLAVVLVLGAVLVALLLSVLIPMLSEPELSPTRWYQHPLAM
jgi:hypothetical protein